MQTRMQHQTRRLILDEFTWDRVASDLTIRYRDIVGSARVSK